MSQLVSVHVSCSSLFYLQYYSVPAIVLGPLNQTVDPTDHPYNATFTCTAYGGDGLLLQFAWSDSVSTGLNTSTQNEIINGNGSITSSISTNNLSLEDDGSQYTCTVSYSDQENAEHSATGTLTIGEFTIYIQLTVIA